MSTTKKHEKVQAITRELGEQFYERREHLEAIWIGLLAGVNTYLLGEPGTGKSLMVRESSKRVVSSDPDEHLYWEVLLDRQLPLESIFGPLDIVHFRNTGEYHRNVTGYLPTARFIFLDEVGKAGPAVLNPLLTVLNEGLYHNNSKPMECNILTAVGASNEELEDELEAMWDRWVMRLIVDPIQEPSNFASLLTKGSKPSSQPTTISLDELIEAREKEVPQVVIPPGVIDSILKLKSQLHANNCRPSDRRWVQAMNVVRAAAWMNGRSTVDEDDLAVLRHVLWDVVEQIETVHEQVLKFTSELTSKAVDLGRILNEIEAEITNRKGQSVEQRARYGGEAQSKIGDVQKKAAKLQEQANREGRSTAKIEQVIDRTKQLKQRVFVECLNVDPDRASQMSSL